MATKHRVDVPSEALRGMKKARHHDLKLLFNKQTLKKQEEALDEEKARS